MKFKAAIIQFSPLLGNVDANIAQIELLFERLSKNVSLVVLPELASTGYNFANKDAAIVCSEKAHKSKFLEFLMSQASKYNCFICSGFNERENSDLFNSSVLIGPHGMVGLYRKLHLFRREKEFFSAGNLGVPVFNTDIGKIGMLVCFDWMFPEVWRMLSMKQTEIVCHPSNLVLPYCQRVVPSYALLNRYYVATANRIGVEGDLTFTGGSVICSPNGEVLVAGTKNEAEIIECILDTDLCRNYQITPENHILNDRRIDVYGNFDV